MAATALLVVALWPRGPATPEPADDARPTVLGRLECEVEGYPCTWSEVSQEAATRTDQIGQIAAALLQAGEPTGAVAELLAEAVDFAELDADAQAVRFRLPGSRPAWVSMPHDHGGPDDDVASVGARPPVDQRSTDQTIAVVSDWVATRLSSLLPVVHAQDRVAGSPGAAKDALVLAPFYAENRLGREAATVYTLLAAVKDFTTDGGRLVFRANLPADPPDATDPFDPTMHASVQGPSTIEQFLDWDTFNFIYLASHGLSICPGDDPGSLLTRRRQENPARDQLIAQGQCHTIIWVQDYPGGAAAIRQAAKDQRYLALPGVEPNYSPGTGAREHPGLTPREASACLTLVKTDPGATAPGTTKPCLFFPEVPTEVTVSAEFFRAQYRRGLSDVVVFLAVCETFKVPDIVTALAPAGSRDVAVFGFRNFVNSYFARVMGTRAVELFVEGFTSQYIKTALDALAPTIAKSRAEADDFDAVIRSPDAPTGAGADGGIVDASSNPTHARDVVLLMDPLTGEELRDGARVAVRGSGGGSGDRLELQPQLIGVAPADEPPTTRLQVRVVGEPVPDESYLPEQRVREGAYRYSGTVALGREHTRNEVVDLEVRADLPAGGESRWTYRNIRLEGFWWRVAVSGGPVAFPVLAGRRAQRQMHVVVGLVDGALPGLSTLPALSIALPAGTSFEQGANTGVVTVRFEDPNYTCAGAAGGGIRLTLESLKPMEGTLEGRVVCTPGRLDNPTTARDSLKQAFEAHATGRFRLR